MTDKQDKHTIARMAYGIEAESQTTNKEEGLMTIKETDKDDETWRCSQ
jgi:hypothetical protein